jgi:multidrug efflux pump subunit AcrA (membrane-fusion protein)
MSARTTPATSERALFAGPGGRRGRRLRVTVTVAGVVVVLAIAAGAVRLAGGFGARGPSGSGNASSLYGTMTQTVKRETLLAQTTLSATLGYAGSYAVSVPSSGSSGSLARFTWLPRAGRVIRQGEVLYRTDNGVPAYLLYGRVPAWRELAEGMRGADVAQLNRDLVRLGYAGSGYIAGPGWDYFSWDTGYGLEQLQAKLGLEQTGTLPLGQAVFEPRALRVTEVRASLGAPASGPVFSATSARHVVSISLDAADQSEVTAGDPVTITLPDGSVTPGVISSVGKVASGSGSSAKITVLVRLRHPLAAGHLDQAPVTVNITTSRAKNALAVPVAALVARPGGYAVEVAGPGAGHRLVPVTPGLFDDAAGLVQVTGPGLAAGQRVVVPAS